MYTTFFSAHTQNAQLADCEEIFAEFDRKIIALEVQITPLSVRATKKSSQQKHK